MASRKIKFSNGEFYHVFNRGTDKRKIFEERVDILRFLTGVSEFNRKEPIGSIYDIHFSKNKKNKSKHKTNDLKSEKEKLVEIIAYCCNPNHYHIILKQKMENGVSEFMKRVGGGYTRYFNNKYDRSGVLFQGQFKAVHIETNEQLIYLGPYVHFNFIVHNLSKNNPLVFSSIDELNIDRENRISNPELITKQSVSLKEYENEGKIITKEIYEKRKDEKIINMILE